MLDILQRLGLRGVILSLRDLVLGQLLAAAASSCAENRAAMLVSSANARSS